MGGGPQRRASSSYQPHLTHEEDADADVDVEVTTHSSESDADLVTVNVKARQAKAGASAGASSDAACPDGLDVGTNKTTSPKATHAPPSLVYAKSKVYIHPTNFSRDNLPGWITIVKRGRNDFLLSWIPESLINDEAKEKFVRVEVVGDGSIISEQEVSSYESDPSSSMSLLDDLSAIKGSYAWSVPLTSIYSLFVTPPTLAHWYGNIKIHLCESYTDSLDTSTPLPDKSIPTFPLFFHDDESPSTMLMMDRRSAGLQSAESTDGTRLASSWGGEDLISALRKYSNVVKSSIQPSLYLINPSQTDLQAHSVPLFEDELPSASAIYAHHQRRRGQSGGAQGDGANARTSILHQSLSPQASTSSSEALPSLDNLTFNVLNSFSRLTNRARSTAQNIAQPILAHPYSKPILKHLPPPIASLANANSPEYSKWAEKAGVAGYDAARVYLARWARTVAEEGERARRSEMRFTGVGGLDEGAFLGGDGAGDGGGPFELLASTYRIQRPRSTRVQGVQPIIESEWKAWFDSKTGKLMLTGDEARKRIFQRGLIDDARKEAWPFLLDVYPWDSTAEDRKQIYRDKQAEYSRLKNAWFGKREVTTTDQFVEEHHRIHIDCLRTDRTQPMFASDNSPVEGDKDWAEMQSAQMAASAIDMSLRGGNSGGQPAGNYHVQKMVEILLTYNVHETELGYVQGMSDLCSPLYVTLEGDEAMVFWCFVNLMEERMKPNFYRDQSGMKRQLSALQELIALMDPQLYQHLEKTDSLNLFFCFRWVLIAFKREFKFDDCLSVWETIWSAPCKSFHLFLAMSILESHRGVITRYLQEFDEVLKYVNELAQTLEPQPLLTQAEVLYLGFRSLVEATDRRKAERASQAQASGASSTEGLRQRIPAGTGKDKEKEKSKDPLLKVLQDETEAEAKVPDIELSEDLRRLLE